MTEVNAIAAPYEVSYLILCVLSATGQALQKNSSWLLFFNCRLRMQLKALLLPYSTLSV